MKLTPQTVDNLATFFETFDAEAEAADLLQLQRYLNRPDEFLELCRSAFLLEDSCSIDCPLAQRDNDWSAYAVPVRIKSIRIANRSVNLHDRALVYTGRAIDDEGIEREYMLRLWSECGSYDDPSDEGIEFDWLADEVPQT